MINKSIITILAFFLSGFLHAQQVIYSDEFSFIGYYKEEPIFTLNSFDHALFTLVNNSGIYGFSKYDYNFNYDSDPLLINDDILVCGSGNTTAEYRLTIYKKGQMYCTIDGYAENIVYSKVNNIIVFFMNSNEEYETIKLDITSETPNPEIIPIKGHRGYFFKNWLYFSFFHVNENYSPYPDDIFRVKIDDWMNPELIFTSDEYDNWFLYPETHLLLTDIDLGNQELNRNNQVIYDVNHSSYAIIPNIKYRRSPSPAYLKYMGKYYSYFTSSDNKSGFATIGLKSLPEIPNSFPEKNSHDVLNREVWYNYPFEKKNFNGTFISSYLLREAGVDGLTQLSKSQLRLLRNAIYAQYGYIFNSSDLIDFFNQFEWYRMIANRLYNKKDIILIESDKKRVELIRSLEN